MLGKLFFGVLRRNVRGECERVLDEENEREVK